MADENNNAKLIEYAINKSRRVVRSVLGTGKFGLVDACAPVIVI